MIFELSLALDVTPDFGRLALGLLIKRQDGKKFCHRRFIREDAAVFEDFLFDKSLRVDIAIRIGNFVRCFCNYLRAQEIINEGIGFINIFCVFGNCEIVIEGAGTFLRNGIADFNLLLRILYRLALFFRATCGLLDIALPADHEARVTIRERINIF